MSFQIKNISIGHGSKPILSQISGHIHLGEVTILLGKNGSGKTTLLRTLLQFIPPLEGEMFLNSIPIQSYSSKTYSQLISVVLSARPANLQMPMQDFLMQGRFPYHSFQIRLQKKEEDLIAQTVKFLRIEDLWDQPIHTLSDGNFQKVAIARAVIQDTPYILFDEPLSHLDVGNQQMILEILQRLAKEQNKGIVFSTHDWSQSVQISDQLWLIKNNQFYTGSTEDLALQEQLISYFSHEGYGFDYQWNRYQTHSNKQPQSIQIMDLQGMPEKVYWLRNALMRNGFKPVDNSTRMVEISAEGYIIVEHGQRTTVQNLEEVIKKLQK